MPNAIFTPLDGRITSLQVLNVSLTGGEVMEIVSPGNAANGNNFQVTLSVLAAFFASGTAGTYVVTSGATIGTPFAIPTNAAKVLFNKTVGAASYGLAPLASAALGNSVLVKDLKGDAATNNITITFTGGQLCDGQSSVVIDNNYGWVTINPTPAGDAWYES